MVLDDYHKGWALRYIREAQDELKTSRKTPSPMDFIVDAARKAQASIYHSLGDPVFIEGIVNEVSEATDYVENPVLRCLVSIERTLQIIEKLPASASEEAAKRANEIIRVASEIVGLVSSQD